MSLPSETPRPQPDQTRRSAGLRIALVASLALNTLFIGGLASAFIRHGGPAGRPNQAATYGLGAYVGSLPGERRREIRRRVGDRQQAMGALRREVRQARDVALEALVAEPFDKEKYVAAQARLIEVEHRHQLAQLDIQSEIAGSMTPDERRNFANWRRIARPAAAAVYETPPPGKP